MDVSYSHALGFLQQQCGLLLKIHQPTYALAPEYQEEDPSKKIFLEFVPPGVLPTPSSFHQLYSPATLESVNQSIAKYGYELRQADIAYLYDLYQNGVRVLQNIYRLPEIYLFQTDDGEKLIFFAHTLIDPKQSPYAEGNMVSYLIQDETILVWEKAVLNPHVSWVDAYLG